MAAVLSTVPFNFGRKDRVAPKHAPFGVLGQCKNLRHREVGGLGLRNGYTPLSMSTPHGTLAAYDLHEFSGRLLALGSDLGDGYPRDLYEYVGVTSPVWHGVTSGRQTLTPFTNLREMVGLPLIENGVTTFDVAAGGGYIALAYIPSGTDVGFVLIVKADTQQTIFNGSIINAFSGHHVYQMKCAYAGGRFYFGGVGIDDNAIRIGRFTPGSSTSISSHVTVDGSNANTVVAWDMNPVTNGTNSELVVAFDRGSSGSLTVKRYNHSAVQQGTTLTFSSDPVQIQVEADELANQVSIFTLDASNNGSLRTYDLSNTLLVGPTSTQSGTQGGMCRLFASGSFPDSVAISVNATSGDVVSNIYKLADHSVTAGQTIYQATLSSRLIAAQSVANPLGFCFAGRITPTATFQTNALFHVTDDAINMVTRDYLNAQSATYINLTFDSTTGSICWTALKSPGVQTFGLPVVTLVDLFSTARRQSAKYGSLLYFAGAPMQVYDARTLVEAGFAEQPTITSITPATGGSLTTSAQYSYVCHFEYTFSDGSLISSPPSDPVDGNTGASDTKNTVVVTTPHTARASSGGGFNGATVVAVLSRTEWETTNTPAALYSENISGITLSLNGLTFILTVNGGSPQTVTFTSAETTPAAVITKLAAGLTGVTVAESGTGSGIVAITDNTSGSGGTLLVGNGTANTILGFGNGQTDTGETSGVPGSVYRRCAEKSVPSSTYGATLSIDDTLADTSLAEQGAIYTQAERGPLSGTLEHDGPRACTFVAAADSRLVIAGLAQSHLFQISKEAFLGESFSFSEFSSFFGQIRQNINGLFSLESVNFLFTTDSIYAIPTGGPDDLGGGAVPTPTKLPALSGLKDWRSLVEVPDGIMAQLDDDKIHLIPRGGGSPAWIGMDVFLELRNYPTITGAARNRADNVVMFAANNAGLTSAKLLLQDFELKTWLVDEPPLQASSGISALVNYGRVVAYASGGTVYVQSASGFTDGSSSPIVGQLTTQPLYPFGLGGHGRIYDGLLSFEFRGACTLDASVSYDDGQTFTALTSFSITGTTGQQQHRRWAFPQANTSSVVFRVTMTPTGTGTEALILNQLDLLVQHEAGSLPELDPAEMGSA